MLWIILGIVSTALAYLLSGWSFERQYIRPERENYEDDDTKWYKDEYKRDLWTWENGRANRVWGWTVAVGVISVMSAIALNMAFDASNRIPEDRYTALYAMNDGMGVHGRFFLGSGTIESSPVYTYYYQDGGQFRLTYKYAGNSYITYTDNTPRLIHHGTKQRYSNWFSIGADDWRVDLYGEEDPYEFQVPEGSIKQGVTLDAQ